jgi:hypothetical protein
MMYGWSLVFLLFVLNGCTPGTPAVGRETAAPVIGPHPGLARFVGEWADEKGDTSYIIASNPDGSVTISLPRSQDWDAVINNVRFDGTTLNFDVYMYYTGKLTFHTLSNPGGQHPFSGARTTYTLRPAAASATLEGVATSGSLKPIEVTVRKK